MLTGAALQLPLFKCVHHKRPYGDRPGARIRLGCAHFVETVGALADVYRVLFEIHFRPAQPAKLACPHAGEYSGDEERPKAPKLPKKPPAPEVEVVEEFDLSDEERMNGWTPKTKGAYMARNLGVKPVYVGK